MRPPLGLTYPQLVLVVLGVVVLLAVGVAASTSTAAFGTYNPAWDGTAELRTAADDAGLDLVVARETTAYDRVPANGTVAIVLSPDEPYDTADEERLARFVRDGGTLVVAEAYGPYGNPLLAAVGATVRVDGDPLRDERHYYRAPPLVEATNVSSHPLVAESDAITLNHGSALAAGNATVLATTSPYAYLDRNRNERLDDDETPDEYPVATIETVGEGQVIVVSDPSLFINVMLERPGNRAFVTALLDGHDRLLVDHSHTADVPPLALAVLVVRESIALQLALGVVALVAVAAISRGGDGLPLHARFRDRLPIGRRRASVHPSATVVDEAALREHLARRYPEWEPERTERVIRAFMARRYDRRDDE